jgi:hypothetical protein
MELMNYFKTGDKDIVLLIKRRVLTDFYLHYDFIGQNIIYEDDDIPIIVPPAGTMAYPSGSVYEQREFDLPAHPGNSSTFSRGDHRHGTPKVNVDGITVIGTGNIDDPLRALGAVISGNFVLDYLSVLAENVLSDLNAFPASPEKTILNINGVDAFYGLTRAFTLSGKSITIHPLGLQYNIEPGDEVVAKYYL